MYKYKNIYKDLKSKVYIMSKTSKYDITILKNKAEYNGQKMNIMNFKHKDKTNVKRKDMVNFCNEILK